MRATASPVALTATGYRRTLYNTMEPTAILKKRWRSNLLTWRFFVRLKLLSFLILMTAAAGYTIEPNIPEVRQMIVKSGLAQQDLGMIVQENGDTIFQLNSTTPFVPASVAKVLTGAAALETLGSDYVFRTQFFEKGAVAGKTF